MRWANLRTVFGVIVGLCYAGVFAAVPVTAAAGGTAGSSAFCANGPLRVGLVAGHSRQRPGATSATGKSEYFFNARFANELVAMSRRAAHPATPLKMFIVNPGAGKMRLRKRAPVARRLGADILLSIHHDSAQKKYIVKNKIGAKVYSSTPNIRGYSLFVTRENKYFSASRRLGLLIGRSLRVAQMHPTEHHAEDIPGERREMLDHEIGLYEAPFAVLVTADMPAVLIEVGVISNRAEEKELNRIEFRARAQLALIEALSAFCTSVRKTDRH